MKKANEQQKKAIKLAKKMTKKAIEALYSMTFDQNIRNARYFEIMAIESAAIKIILEN